MCHLFIDADVSLWESETRSIRISGMVTSVRLEQFFWSLLEQIARRDAMNVAKLVSRLNEEFIRAGHDLGNFTSFLRVCCARFMKLQLSGDIPLDPALPIAGLDVTAILARERQQYQADRSKSVSGVVMKRVAKAA